MTFTIDILDFSPGDHRRLVMVVDEIGRVAADTVSFVTPPLPSVSCRVQNNVLRCDSANDIFRQVCQFDGAQSSMPCSSPFDIIDTGLPLGPHSVKVLITDVFGRNQTVSIDFNIISNLMINCNVLKISFDRKLNCRHSGGIGTVSYTCSYNGEPDEDCKLPLTSYIYKHHSILLQVLTVSHYCSMYISFPMDSIMWPLQSRIQLGRLKFIPTNLWG